MNAAIKVNEVKIKTNFTRILNDNKDLKKAELNLIKKLEQYTTSSFLKSVWIMDQNNTKIDAVRVSFKPLSEFGYNMKYLVKLYSIILLERGRTTIGQFPGHIKIFFIFLCAKNINLLQCDIKIFIIFQYWLDNDYNKLTNNTKKAIFATMLNFFDLMYGHDKISKIDGVKSVENPYKSDDSERFKVIEDLVLEKLDNYFMSVSIKVRFRIAYWLLRLYGVRPYDLCNYPLDCAKKLSHEIATLKHAVVKNAKSSKGIDYKLKYLNLNEPMQKMLYKLIIQQQEISRNLQKNAIKKNFLFTYKTKSKILYFDSQKIRQILRKANIELNIALDKRAIPRDFKKTAVTLRANDGWSSDQLKIFSNHDTYDSLDAYSRPSDIFMIDKQNEILQSEKKISDAYVFNGKIINNINSVLEEKILSNLRAHKIPDLGFCPDISHCGNHFECIDCDFLLPDAELKSYYLEQADRYLEIAEKQHELNDSTNARDSFHRASLFAQLFNKVINHKEK